MTNMTASGRITQAALFSSRTWALVGAAMLGLVLVGGVGFAGTPFLHDAAHDARHTLSFPCH
ncbi:MULTISPECIES: CbtB domain-containing protein [Rhizobium/Agrobacterium group]|jgi:cobalt transporter subunit CbtB|uniref:CbtB domain-containing protein n=1 Tax=Rhizobium/Agrobacterium group TaxID=227290 RepID=UPI000978AB77|nr:CbtB-domain containing protein [Rhizobium sp. TRM95796]MCV3768112.1 CbtB-domain containing protein [Rhizobium sp. TRM95796]OMP69578.1 cobalt transporter subunit CbtB [Agrobacterium tumefaciens]